LWARLTPLGFVANQIRILDRDEIYIPNFFLEFEAMMRWPSVPFRI